MSRKAWLGATSAAALALLLAAATPAFADDSTTADVTPPVIQSTGLTDGQLVPAVGIFLPTVTDDVGVTKVTISLNGLTNLGACSVTTTRIVCKALFYELPDADGSDVDVTMTAYDKAGNASTPVTTRVHVDAVAPKGTLSPAVGTGIHSGPVTVTLSALSDDVAKIEMNDGSVNAPALATVTSAPWTFTWDASETAAAPCFKIFDQAGNYTTICSKYVVADEPPVIEKVVSYEDYSSTVLDGGAGWAGEDASFEATVTGRAPVDHYQWWVDGKRKDSGTGVNIWYYWHDATPHKTLANVELRVWDTAGNEATKAFKVNVDNVAPTLSITPANNALVRGGTFTTTAKATDPRGIGYLDVTGADDAHPTGYITTRFVLKSGKDGTRSYAWLAYDKLGNQVTVRRTVIVDNTAPSLSITKAPANNKKLSAKVTIAAKANDRNGVAKVQLLVNGKVVSTDSKAGYSFTLNPKRYGKKFTVQLRAYDKAGNLRYSAKRTYRR
jgi:hypothetical protein